MFVSDLNKYIGILHLCGMMIENIYGFFREKDKWCDTLYMLSFVMIPFSWLLCKDECIVSYIIKKKDNPYYMLGDEPENVNDISDLFPSERLYFYFFIPFSTALRCGSVIIVNYRTTHIPMYIISPTILLYVLYNYDISYKLHYRKRMYPYFHILFLFFISTTFTFTIISFFTPFQISNAEFF
jgi:hypothetical protein